jgi:hypothetical protein
MGRRPNVETKALHEAFVSGLGDWALNHSNIEVRPLEVDVKPPLPTRLRVYMHNLTEGRTADEFNIKLKVPKQKIDEVGSFDYSDGKRVLLVGYEPSTGVFVLWDADLYPQFVFSRSLQVKADTVYHAMTGKVVQQLRSHSDGEIEIVLATTAENLALAIKNRAEISYDRPGGL